MTFGNCLHFSSPSLDITVSSPSFRPPFHISGPNPTNGCILVSLLRFVDAMILKNLCCRFSTHIGCQTLFAKNLGQNLHPSPDQWPNICSKIFDRNVIFNQWKWGFSTGRPPQLSSFFCPGTPGPKPPRGVPWRPRELLCRPWGGRKRARRCWVCP